MKYYFIYFPYYYEYYIDNEKIQIFECYVDNGKLLKNMRIRFIKNVGEIWTIRSSENWRVVKRYQDAIDFLKK